MKDIEIALNRKDLDGNKLSVELTHKNKMEIFNR
jgi:hypothetical protein